MKKFPPLVLGLVIALRLFAAAPGEIADPSTQGFDAARLARLDALIQSHVEREQLAGAVLSVWRHGQPVRFRAFGEMDREQHRAMRPDAIFRIASMSKAVTSVAALMLYEEGKLMLHDPVEKYLPEFRGIQVAVADAASSTGYVLHKAHRPPTVRDLLTHCAGLTYGAGPAEADYKKAGLTGWYLADRAETIAEVVKRLAQQPLQGQPGEVYQYGYSTDVLGRLVEVVSGLPLDRFFAERIFQPLQMVDTSFFLPTEKADRLAVVYGMKDGKLQRGDQGHYVDGPRKCFSGGAGLLSTASDYHRLLQMLLNEGQLDGVRLLAPKTVRLMSQNHTGKLFDGQWARAFGLGFWVIEEGDVGFHGELGSEGSYGWGSAYFPQYLVDPREGIVALLMCQHMPDGGSRLNQQFKVLMYQALIQ